MSSSLSAEEPMMAPAARVSDVLAATGTAATAPAPVAAPAAFPAVASISLAELEAELASITGTDVPRERELLAARLDRDPAAATTAARLRLAILEGDHGDLDRAIELADGVLAELPADTERLHALRRTAGLHRRRGEVAAERARLVEALSLAQTLSEAQAELELAAALRFLDRS